MYLWEWRIKMAKSNRHNLSRVLEHTLAGLAKNGVAFAITQQEAPPHYVAILIKPSVMCDECGHLSAAAECLWCEEEYDGRGVA
jgi:hypothetical protein